MKQFSKRFTYQIADNDNQLEVYKFDELAEEVSWDFIAGKIIELGFGVIEYTARIEEEDLQVCDDEFNLSINFVNGIITNISIEESKASVADFLQSYAFYKLAHPQKALAKLLDSNIDLSIYPKFQSLLALLLGGDESMPITLIDYNYHKKDPCGYIKADELECEVNIEDTGLENIQQESGYDFLSFKEVAAIQKHFKSNT